MNPSQEHDFQCLMLGALLHDIGKFWQRAGKTLTGDEAKTIGTFCPSFQGRSSHIHAAISARFIESFLGTGWSLAEYIAGYHHRPESAPAEYRRLAMIVAFADRLSSGERKAREDSETGRPGEEPLTSIFSTLFGHDRRTYFPLASLSDKCDRHTPLSAQGPALGGAGAYAVLWRDFEAEFRAVAGNRYDLLFNQTLSLLEKHAFFVPSAAYKDEADISLYHHSKSTAAIAAALYRSGLSEESLGRALGLTCEPPDETLPVAHLVGGDVSGIQDFIYNLTSKGALKGLRGRSFYLQLLPEAIAGRILDEFCLTRANLIYCGGGHFYVLVPEQPDTSQRLNKVAAHVARTLLCVHGGRLSVALAARPLVPSDFGRAEFGAAWDALHQELAREKRRRFAGLMTDESGIRAVLGPHGLGGEEKACIVCGEELKSSRAGKCDACGSFEELAGRLTDACAIVESVASSTPERPNTWQEALSAIGRDYAPEPRPAREGLNLVLNTTDFAPDGFAGFRFLAKHAPRKEGTESMAELGDMAGRSDGISRWGVLRADVDNLGKAFAEGLGDNRSVSRLSMLSHLLGYFFSARVQALAEDAEFKDKVYLVYSGGDDLFAIGAWSALPGFARRVYDEFRGFTSERLSLSAGVALAPGERFPVYEAADLAAEALDAAKLADASKDRLSFLGAVVRWSDLSDVQATKDRLVDLILNKHLPKSVLGILRATWALRQQAKAGEIPMFPVWRMYYAFKRLKERHKEAIQQIDDLEKALVRDNDLHPHLDLIVRWAEFEIRRKDDAE